MASFAGRVSIDLGTGDGRLPFALAATAPNRLFIGIDASAAALRDLSGRALRARLRNLVYVRAAVEDLPPELSGTADALTVVLPWGSLLAAVARPQPDALRGIRRLCQPGASLTVVLAPDAARDRAELERLGLPALDAPHLARLSDAYGAAGFDRLRLRTLEESALARWPSTWARRLAHAPGRAVFEVQARAAR